MRNKVEDEYEDDGHAIVDMSSVERPNLFSFRNPSSHSNVVQEKKENDRPWEDNSLNSSERRWAILGALKASLMIGFAYIIGLGIIILLLVLYFNK